MDERKSYTLGEKSPEEIQEATEIVSRVQSWAGSEAAAWTWYRSTRIPSLGNLTAEELVSRGRGEDVRDYLIHLSDGGYA